MPVDSETTHTPVVMRGYVSDLLAGRPQEWPSAWAIVEAGERWKATLPVEQLVEMLTAPSHVPLNGIQHHWEAEQLVLHLGPAHVAGTSIEWRALIRRLVDAAGSTRELYETPQAQPWHEAVSRLTPNQVIVPGADGHWMYRQTPSEEVQDLATSGGFEPLEFVTLFGANWELHHDPDWSQQSLEFVGIYTWGSPAQLAARLDLDGLLLGTPHVTWGTTTRHVGITDEERIHGWMTTPDINDTVERIRRRRRRSFTWCRYCGRQIAREDRIARDVCYGCSTEWHGTIY